MWPVNNVGLVTQAQNLRPDLPPPVATLNGYRTASIIAAGSTQISLSAIGVPPSGKMSDYVGAVYLQSQADVTTYMAGPHTTPAFYLAPFSASIPADTTFTAVGPGTPPSHFDISAPVQANIPAPIGPGPSITVLMPDPVIPTVATTVWGGAEGAIATLNSALSKTGDIAQTIGNSLNGLQAAQDHASQQIDVVDSGIGNLVDADLGNVGAQMQSLQIRRQLATQALSLGSQWPQLLFAVQMNRATCWGVGRVRCLQRDRRQRQNRSVLNFRVSGVGFSS